MTHSVRRILEGAVGLVVVTAAIVWLSGGCEERVSPGVAEIAHRMEDGNQTTAVVEEVTAPTVEWASGEIASASHTAVASRVLSRIEEVRVRAGSSVSEGDVLIRLDARDLAAQVGEAREAQRAAEARLELAETEQARTEQLFRRDAAPRSRLDQSTSELQAARADLAGRKDALRQAMTGASFAEIRSPVNGRVVDRLAEPGDIAVPGRPLVRIYDPDLLRVEAPVRESLAVRLSVGEPLEVDIPALGEPVVGRIDEIVPFAERGARTLLVKVSLPKSDERLFAGMYARVAIPAGERRFVLVPNAAIERIGQLEYATVVSEGQATDRRLVTTGESREDGRIEVLSGLRAKERVRLPATTSKAKSLRPSEAAGAVDQLRKKLGSALETALASGPSAAIDVCRIDAPRLTRDLRVAGITVGRTSQRLRNPFNAPEAWMEPLLSEFAATDPSPGAFRIVNLGERGSGYVEPIYMQPLCMTCHGDSVDSELLSQIREYYPDDRAVGFKVGELRGMFWAVVERE